jgi:site-specific DNA-methyltransferase (adenine-specific)
MINLIHGDCLEEMDKLVEQGVTVDMVMTDPPYGTTACKWDAVIPPWAMWNRLNRLVKPNGAIVMTASQPFTTTLIASNMKMFRYCWVWEKNRVTGFANAKKQPLRCIEDVAVFYSKPPTYNPQGLTRINKKVKNGKSVGGNTLRTDVDESANKGSLRTAGSEYVQEFTGYPKQTLRIKSANKTIHPTQKPVALMEYLIKTYTNEGETVLDFTMGSGTTGVACQNLNRNFIGIEKDEKYFEIAKKRINLLDK